MLKRGRSRLAVGTLALTLTATLSGCSADSHSDLPQVIASFYPLQFVAQRIVGDQAEVTDLTGPGVEPHDLELTVRQAAKISGADVVIYEKGVSPAVDGAVANDGPGHVLDTTTVVPLKPPVPGEEATNGESMDNGDPHFWQDPTLLAKVATAFTHLMVKVDPADKASYDAEDDRMQRDLKRLDEDYRTGLAHCRTRTLVVSHDAFEYLGRRYHLDIEPIAGLSPDAEPSAKHLSQLSSLIRKDKITTVFSERLASPKMADTLASDLGITTAVLDPIEGLTPDDSSADYLTLMRQNLAAIKKANGCS
ncbi:MAG TPA: metal ABC transporter substrate-binding protein [Marmoricola sp.]